MEIHEFSLPRTREIKGVGDRQKIYRFDQVATPKLIYFIQVRNLDDDLQRPTVNPPDHHLQQSTKFLVDTLSK
jgi:hypothetical protein